MNRQSYSLIIALVGLLLPAGCASTIGPPLGTDLLPLNRGMTNLSFLSAGEREILETANRTRGEGATPGTPKPLRVSRGLSQAAKARAEELARTGPSSQQEEPDRFFERLGSYGARKGRAAEIVSYGYSEGAAVITGFMRSSTAEAEESRANLLDPTLTVVGVGCAPSGRPGPICVIDLAAEFRENGR